MGSLFIWGNSALIGLLNESVAGPGNPASIGVDFICNKTRLMLLLLLLKHFNGTFQKPIHASTCPLFWWYHDGVMAWSMFSCLQNCLKWSDMKFEPASETFFFKSPNSVKTI